MLRTSSSSDSSVSATQIAVEYNGIDGGGGKLVEKVVKKSKNCQKVQRASKVWKICKGHRFEGTFTKAPVLRQQRTWAFVKALTVFRALFPEPRKSSLDIIFESIINRVKLMELLMLCRVFPQRSQEDLWAENTRVFYLL